MTRGRYFVAALANLIPGFGLGYLLTGRGRLFKICLVGWVVAAIIGILLGSSIAALCEFYACRPGATIMVGAAFTLVLGFLFVNLPTAIHLTVSALLNRIR